MSYVTALLSFLVLKGHHREESKNPFHRLNNNYIEADRTLSLYSTNNPRSSNLEVAPAPADDNTDGTWSPVSLADADV
jgi:hypothetical protein